MSDQLLDDIIGGVHDDGLDAINEAVKERRAVLNRRMAANLSVGTSVRFTREASPKYLQGALATVMVAAKSGGKSVTISLDEDVGRFNAGRSIRCPVSIIEEVPS